MSTLDALVEDENECRQEEQLGTLPERREERSITDDPRSGDRIRIPELVDEEKRDECASLVSFTSSLYSDPIGQHTATLMNRMRPPSPHLQQDDRPSPVNVDERDTEERESPPPTNDEEGNRVVVEQTGEEEHFDKELDEDFYNELSLRPRSWVAWYYPRRFMKYWRDETDERVCMLLLSRPEEVIQAARDSGLYAETCIAPEVKVPVDIDSTKNMTKCVKLSVNNSEQTIILARSEEVGQIVCKKANERIKSLLDEKVSQFTSNKSKTDEDKYEYVFELIPTEEPKVIDTGYPSLEENVLITKSLELLQNKLNCKTDKKADLNGANDAGPVDGNGSIHSRRSSRNDDESGPEMMKNQSKSFFGKKFYQDNFYAACAPLCACTVSPTIGGMCVGPEWKS